MKLCFSLDVSPNTHFLIVSLCNNTKRRNVLKSHFWKQKVFKSSFWSPWLSCMKMQLLFCINSGISVMEILYYWLMIIFKFLLEECNFLLLHPLILLCLSNFRNKNSVMFKSFSVKNTVNSFNLIFYNSILSVFQKLSQKKSSDKWIMCDTSYEVSQKLVWVL